MSYEKRYAVAVRQRADRAASSPEAEAARARHAAALASARADVRARFPEVTPANAEAAFLYLDERIAHWRAVLGG